MENQKQIVFKVHKEFHKLIKIAAATKGVSMNLWIANALYEQLQKEKANQA